MASNLGFWVYMISNAERIPEDDPRYRRMWEDVKR